MCIARERWAEFNTTWEGNNKAELHNASPSSSDMHLFPVQHTLSGLASESYVCSVRESMLMHPQATACTVPGWANNTFIFYSFFCVFSKRVLQLTVFPSLLCTARTFPSLESQQSHFIYCIYYFVGMMASITDTVLCTEFFFNHI